MFTGKALNSDELQLRTTMRTAWASFVVRGTPTLPSLNWPKYGMFNFPRTRNCLTLFVLDTNKENYVNLDLTLSIGEHFRDSYCSIFGVPDSTMSEDSSSATFVCYSFVTLFICLLLFVVQ